MSRSSEHTGEQQYFSDAVAGQFEHQYVEKRDPANGEQWLRVPSRAPRPAAQDSSLADHFRASSFIISGRPVLRRPRRILSQPYFGRGLCYKRTSPDE